MGIGMGMDGVLVPAKHHRVSLRCLTVLRSPVWTHEASGQGLSLHNR